MNNEKTMNNEKNFTVFDLMIDDVGYRNDLGKSGKVEENSQTCPGVFILGNIIYRQTPAGTKR